MVKPHSFGEQEHQINRENGSGRSGSVLSHEQRKKTARH